MEAIVVSLLEDKMSRVRAEAVAEELVSSRYTHDYPITVEDARRMGLPARPELPPEVYQLMELYPQAYVQGPGVEYMPYPYALQHPHPAPRRAAGERAQW